MTIQSEISSEGICVLGRLVTDVEIDLSDVRIPRTPQ